MFPSEAPADKSNEGTFTSSKSTHTSSSSVFTDRSPLATPKALATKLTLPSIEPLTLPPRFNPPDKLVLISGVFMLPPIPKFPDKF